MNSAGCRNPSRRIKKNSVNSATGWNVLSNHRYDVLYCSSVVLHAYMYVYTMCTSHVQCYM